MSGGDDENCAIACSSAQSASAALEYRTEGAVGVGLRERVPEFDRRPERLHRVAQLHRETLESGASLLERFRAEIRLEDLTQPPMIGVIQALEPLYGDPRCGLSWSLGRKPRPRIVDARVRIG